MGRFYVLFECASGYGLFERVENNEIGQELEDVQQSVVELSRFSQIIKMKSFLPFTSAENALENIMAVSEGSLHEHLKNFLEMNFGKSKKEGKSSKFEIGVSDPKLGNVIVEELGYACTTSRVVEELLRGIRVHIGFFIEELKDGALDKAQLGLAHSYSRAKVKFNVHRVDNMIIQAINIMDQLDKDLNTFAMRVKEWYSWHFPELRQLVNDNYMYARLVQLIGTRPSLSEESVDAMEEIVGDGEVASQILDAARMSMGSDVSDFDIKNIRVFADRVVKLAEYRQELREYLGTKMNACAPNLAALVGDQVGARLISHAGSLTNLSKYPASTVQILGAEKALFRALKTRGNTPKYGLLFHSSFIGRAGAKNKGRISRYLANKCTIASRYDCFADELTNKVGEKLRQQVEDRLSFYENGTTTRKNIDVMKEAMGEVAEAVKDAAKDADMSEATPKKSSAAKEEAKTPKSSKKDKSSKDKKEKSKDKKEKSKDKKEKSKKRDRDEDGEKKKSKKSKKSKE